MLKSVIVTRPFTSIDKYVFLFVHATCTISIHFFPTLATEHSVIDHNQNRWYFRCIEINHIFVTRMRGSEQKHDDRDRLSESKSGPLTRLIFGGRAARARPCTWNTVNPFSHGVAREHTSLVAKLSKDNTKMKNIINPFSHGLDLEQHFVSSTGVYNRDYFSWL